MPSSNPFVYGEIVPASAFVGRADELGRLTADLTDGQKVFLISPRRYGKSSLVHQAFRTLQRRNVVTLEFTVSSFSSYVGFLEGYARALVNLEARTPRSGSWLRELFAGVTPEVRVEPGAGTRDDRVRAQHRDGPGISRHLHRLHLGERIGQVARGRPRHRRLDAGFVDPRGQGFIGDPGGVEHRPARGALRGEDDHASDFR